MTLNRFAAIGLATLLSSPAWAQSTVPAAPNPSVGPSNPSVGASSPSVSPANPSVGPSKPAVGPGSALAGMQTPRLANPGPSGTVLPVNSANQPTFGSLDGDNNGSITKDEVPSDTAFGGDNFSVIDTNHDGKISSEEFAAWERKTKTLRTNGTNNP